MILFVLNLKKERKMANKVQILDKIARNLEQLGMTVTRGSACEVVAQGLTVSYTDADIQSPMGGVDGDISPFLGIGVANPGQIKIKGDAGENTLAAIWTTSDKLQVLQQVAGHANDITVEAGDTATELAYLRGSADVLGLGM